LLVYGYDTPIIAIDSNNNIRTITTPLNEDFFYISQFISINDQKGADGVAITNLNDIIHFNITNATNATTTISKRSPINFDPSEDGSIQSVNYCKRKNYNPATMKT
jgi:hypothetical protein